jgi:hypothetical protein
MKNGRIKSFLAIYITYFGLALFFIILTSTLGRNTTDEKGDEGFGGEARRPGGFEGRSLTWSNA